MSTSSSSSVSLGLGGRVCVVTGGAQGIGEACARRFARDAVLRVNLTGSFLMGQAVARAMAKAPPRPGAEGRASRGAIVNIVIDGGRMTLNYTVAT